MEKDLYLTQAPISETPQTSYIPQKQRINAPKSLSSPNDRRNQISKRMLSNFPLQGYYDDKKIKPGISLYKIILQTQDKRKQGLFKGPYLRMKMHPTVTFTDNVNSMIYCQNETIRTTSYISYEQFLSKLGYTQKQYHKKQLHPVILTKCCNSINFEHNIIMNTQIGAKIIPRSENVITTKFSLPFAMYPNVIRLFFTPRNVKSVKRNIGYKIINRKQMNDQVFKKKQRLSNNYLVNVDNQQSYIATLIKGKALQPCENMSQSLSDYLQKALLIKIHQMVIDFIVDQNKQIYFHDIRAIRSKNKTKLWDIGCQQQIQKLAKQNNNQIMCRLCGMLYTKYQMEKLVTNKLIYQLSAHLENRNKKLMNIPHVKKEGLSNVCHLCYELIKAEYTLINVQRQFSKLMNIKQSTFNRVQAKQNKPQLSFYDEEQFQTLGQQTSKYKKWRLFFYLEKIKRIPQLQFDSPNIQVTLQMKFQNQKQKFNKIIPNQNHQYYNDIMLSKHGKLSKTSFMRQSSRASSIVRLQSANIINKYNRFRISNQQLNNSTLNNTHNNINYHKVNINNNNNNNVNNNNNNVNNNGQSLLAGLNRNQNEKNKSFFNDQTTCITHSQSYFSTQKQKTRYQPTNNPNNISAFSNININNTNNITTHNSISKHYHNNNQYNQLDSLYEDPQQQNDYQPILDNLNKTIVQDYSCLPQASRLTKNQSIPNVPVQKVKMFQFYTKTHQNQGCSILSDQQLQFTLTFNNHKFTGNSSTLKCLKNKQTCQRHSLQIYLFEQNNGMKYCNLQLTVGMICDGIFDDQELQLEKYNNLYWGKIYGCQPLPDQWMEVFTNGEEVPKCNPEKVLENLQANNYSTSPQKMLQKSNSVNYIENFRNTMNRPMSGYPISNITTNLKKTSIIRCKTAVQRKGNNGLLILNAGFKNQINKSKQNNIQDIVAEEQCFQFDI